MTEKGWIPEFFGRTYGWERGAVGMWYGTIVMTMGSAGIVFGGRLADKLSKAGRRDGRMYVGFIAAVVWIVTGVVYPLVPNGTLAMILLAPTVFFCSDAFRRCARRHSGNDAQRYASSGVRHLPLRC